MTELFLFLVLSVVSMDYRCWDVAIPAEMTLDAICFHQIKNEQEISKNIFVKKLFYDSKIAKILFVSFKFKLIKISINRKTYLFRFLFLFQLWQSKIHYIGFY